MAHDAGALVVVDGAQAGPKLPLDMAAMGADFYALTSHKMYGPTGIGALYGRRELLEEMPPFIGGGSMIREVRRDEITWADLPREVRGRHPADRRGDRLRGRGRVARHHRSRRRPRARGGAHGLRAGAPRRRSWPPRLRSPHAGDDRAGIVSFELEGVHAHDVSEILDRHAVCVRAGHHCAQILMERLGVAATTRASFAVYNTREEIDRLVDALDDVRRVFELD